MSEILINTTTTGVQHQPDIAVLRNTHFFVVWADRSDLTIKGQIIQGNGNMSGGEFVVNTPTPTGANANRQQPTIASSGARARSLRGSSWPSILRGLVPV